MTTDTIKDKIRKLLALGEGGANENESARAMELASKLMMQHGIDRSELTAREKSQVAPGVEMDLVRDWYLYAGQGVGLLFGTRIVQRGSDKFWFVGRRDNLEASEDTLAFVILQVEQLYKAGLPKGMTQKERAAYRRDFKRACAIRIYHRCSQIVKEQVAAPASGTAIVIHRQQLDNEIAEYFADSNVRMTKSRGPKFTSSAGMIAGSQAGNAVDLNRKVG